MKFLSFILCLLLLHFCSEGQITGIKISGDTCSNFTLDLQAEGTSNSPYFFWHFGDPASGTNDSITITGSSTAPFPTHTFSGPGFYTVCVSFQEPGAMVTTVCRTISIGLCCNGTINYVDSCLQNPIQFSCLTGAAINNINWNFGDAASGANNSSSALNPTHQFTSVGTYTVTATVNAPCGNFQDTSIVTIVNCNTAPCTGTIMYTDTCVSSATSFQLNSSYPILSVNWNFDDPNSGVLNTSTGLNPSHQFTTSKLFNIRAVVNFTCGVDTLYQAVNIITCNPANGNACTLTIPNSFSPNGDNLNDFFLPLSACAFEKYELLIYNRWGEQIFKSTNPAASWNGEHKGVACPVGVYGYLLKYKFPNSPNGIRKGDITLIK